MHQIVIHAKDAVRSKLKVILQDKGISNYGFYDKDSYIYLNTSGNFFYSIREVKGQKYVYLNEKYLPALSLLPKEAIVTFLLDVVK